jgi:zona occludens toxin
VTISLVTGPPGSGKSFYAVKVLAEAVWAGKFVGTNVELAPDWAERLVRAHPRVRWLSKRKRAERAALYRRRVYVSHDLDALFRLRLRGAGEGRGLMVLDEAHNWMNARSWGAGDRATIVRFFTQHRKLGWHVQLITQDADMLDRQVRVLMEEHITLKNLRNFKLAGIRVFPRNRFVAVCKWFAADAAILWRRSYGLNKRVASLYDSMATSHGLDEDAGDPIWLPLLPDVASDAPAPAGAVAAGPEPARVGVLVASPPASPTAGPSPSGGRSPEALPSAAWAPDPLDSIATVSSPATTHPSEPTRPDPQDRPASQRSSRPMTRNAERPAVTPGAPTNAAARDGAHGFPGP